MRPALAAVVVAAALLVGCDDEDDSPSMFATPQEAREAVDDAPPPLAALYARANALVDGGPRAFRRQISALAGHPVVVNKWASWCGPCRYEFPFFQSQAEKRGREIAFLGVNSNDNDGDARAFLEKFPLPYPSFRDPDSKVAAVFKGGVGFPSTAFYDSDGELAYVRQGGYASEAALERDIRAYAR